MGATMHQAQNIIHDLRICLQVLKSGMTGFDNRIVLWHMQAEVRVFLKKSEKTSANNTARAILSPFQMKDLAPAFA